MATNYISPYERRARAQAIRAERESRRAIYNNRLNQINAPQTAQNISDSAEAQTASQSEASPFVRTFATAGDVIGNVLTGAAKGLEGIFDLGASIVGAIGGIFDSNFQEDVKEIVAYNAADEWIGQPLNELTSDSYLPEGGFIENVASGIGQMLPAVLLAIPTGGSSLASLGTMAVSAAGTGTESAFQDGADYYAGLGYGVASGAVEAVTEKMFGGATKAIFGKGALDAGKAVASTGIKRIAKNALEEGAEEIASELASPALKGIYKGGEAFEEYTQGDYWKGVLEAGGVGAATSLAYTGTVGNILAKKGKALSNRETDINDSLEAIGRQKRAAEQLFAENALTEINERKISANIRRNYENIQRALTKSKPEKRAEMIEKFSLGSAFDSDGLMKADFAATLGIEGDTNADTRYYSPSLRGQEEYINQRLEELGTRIYSGELTQEEQARYDKLKKVQNALSQKGLISSKLVLADTAAEFDSFLNDDIIVMGKDALESDVWQQKIIHETVHFTERTKEWEDFASFILNETDTEAAIQSVLQRDYGATKEDVDAVRAAMSDGKLDTSQLTDKQMLLVSEAVAYQSEALFGSEQMLEKLASTKTSLAHRILERIRHFIQVIRASSPEERKLINTLDNARRLLEKALNKAGSFYASEIYAARNSRVAEDGGLQYNDNVDKSQSSRKKASYISYDKIGAENVSYVREKLNELFSGIDDAVADGIAIEKGTTVYIVDSGKENGEISFGFRAQKIISNNARRKEQIRRINNDAISRGFLSDGLSSRLGSEPAEHIGRDMRRELREESSAGTGESQHNQSGISRTNGDRGRRVESENGSTGGHGVKFSLKKPLEYTKDLIAVHNLSESNLLNNISLGGFAMPSIAVLRADGSHSSYGDISVIFRPDAVNPQADSDNKIYSADAYTPRFLQVEYSLNRRALTALAEKLNTSTSSLEVNEFAGGDRNKIIENLSYNANAKELFAKENGLTVTPVLHEPEYSHSIYKIAAVRDYIASGISFHDLVYDEATRKEFIDIIRNAPTLKSMTAKWADRINGELDDAKNNQVIYEVLEETFENDRSIAMQKAEKIETSSSYAEGLDELVKEHADEYDAFIEKLVDSVLDKKWLRNNKPYYTNSGNPRSFKDLHEEYTAQNAVQLMKEQGSKVVEGGLFGYGVGEIRAALSKTYDSFDSLHKDEARIQDNQDEAIKAQYDKCSEALNEICGEIAGLSKVENKFMAHDIASAAVLDIISKTKSDTYAKAYVKKEYSIDITDEIVSKIRKLAKEIEKLPVKYFEAKPQRVVGFEEIAAVVVPSSVSESTISKLEELGIDVIVYNKDVPEDRKEAVNSIGNVRFSRKERKSAQQLSPGQLRRVIANNTRRKVYSKADAETIINNILTNYMDFGDAIGNISGKTKTEAINMLWESLNSLDEGRRAGFALDVADYIIYETTLENIWQDESLSEHTYIVEAIQPYLHTLDLSSLSAEIKNRYDGDNSIYLRWAKPKGERGISLDAAAMELAGTGINIANYNPADILFELDDMYRESKKALSANVKKLLTDSLDSKAREQLRQNIAKEVLRGFEYTGKASKLDGIISKYEQEIKKWQKRYYEEKAWNNAANKALYAIQKLRDFKTGAFLNASQYKSEIFKGSISKLTKISSRGNLNTSGTRRVFAGLREWYNKDNPMLEDVYSEETAAMLDRIAANEKPLTNEELDIINELEKMSGLTGYAKLRDWYTKAELKEKYNPETKKLLRELANEKSFSAAELRDIANTVDYFRHFAETFNKVLRNGKWVEARPIAEEYVELLQENQKIKIGWMNKVSGSSYARTFYDPAAVARRADLYENGFYTQSLLSFREGAANAAIDEMEILEPLEEFRTRNKKYFKALDKRKVKYNGQEIPATHALALYLTLGREQAQRGLAESGFKYEQDKTTVRINGFAPGGRLTGEALSQKAAEMQRGLYEQLNETDRELLSILREIFNKKCRDLKMSTDILLNGYSNVLNGEYMPIRRGNIAHGLEMDSWETEVNSVSNASFNKDTVQGAKGELLIESVMDVVYRHVKGITLYANLAPAVETYNRLLNMDISGNPNKPVSVATESQNVWREGRKYFEKLLDDIKGIPSSKGPGGRFFGQVRSGYALSVLGGNPKVWLTQLTSFAAATSILDTDSIIRGLKVDSADVDKYCPLAKLRNNDNTAAAAQGVLEQVGKIGNVLTKPISKVDRFVIKRLFGACQVQIQKDSGFKIGTEQNKIKAGELLKKVIFETQQNALATERSAAMRSGSELMKTFTMFSSDAMKTIGRAIDGIGELTVLKQRRKLATDPKEIEYLDKRIKQARKKARKGITALVTSSIFMALITQLFRFLYNKDDEEDNVIENMTVDAVGNLLGGLPIIKDVYARLTEGYELDSYAYSTINNLMDSAAGIFNMTEDIISGKVDAKETARNVRNVLYSAGQLFGIPVRNMYNVGYGLTKRFSPSTAYNIDNMFYDQSYASDLAKAIEAEDDNMIATIAGIMLNENVGEVTSSAVRQELNRLIKAGYDVLPRSIGDSVAYDGEILELNNAQQRQFKQTYSEANEAAAKLVGLSQYKEASEEVKAKAVNFIYDVYYNRALEKLLGIELDNKAVLFSKSLDVPKLAIILMTAQSLTADKDKNGKSISGTKKAKVQTYINSLNLSAAQKYMIMGYLGYSNKNGSSQVKAYIQGLQLSKMQKEQLYAYSGYAA